MERRRAFAERRLQNSVVSLFPRSTLEPAEPSGAAIPLRIRHIDSLRAVAAGLVVWTHLAESLASASRPNPAFLGFLKTLPPAVDLGRIGVILFFAISGFVICRSFNGPREGGARRFLIRRVCRLYPAFLFSVPGGILVWHIWWGNPVGWGTLAANLTMMPGLLGQKPLLGLYWTLQVEIVFYGLCLGLYLLNGLHRRVVLGGIAVTLAVLHDVVPGGGRLFGWQVEFPGEAANWAVCLAVMFWGAFFRTVYDETGGFRRRVFARPGVYVLAALTWVVIDEGDPSIRWAWQNRLTEQWYVHLALIVPMLVFVVWVAVLRVDNRVATYLGVISYSWYLLHAVVMIGWDQLLRSAGVGHWLHLPLWVNLGLCAGMSVALAGAVYRWVEKPGIALGKRWAGRIGEKASRQVSQP